MKPTLTDIAKQADVSLSTVSLVLSGKGKISDAVREKVRAVAREMGYRKPSARRVEKARTAAVLFHFDHNLAHTWNYLRQVTLKLQECLAEKNILTLLIPITYAMSDDEIFRRVLQSGASAVFSMHFGRENLFARFEDEGMPVVVVINSQFQTRFHTVCADNFQGSYEAAAYLCGLGHRDIAYAEFDIYQLPSTLGDRYHGFYKAMRERGLDLPQHNRLSLDIRDGDDILRKLAKIFDRRDRPTALFYVDDYLAAHCAAALTELGLFVPGDVSVIAAGEVLDYREPYIPAVTTMRTSPELLGKFGAEMLFTILANSQTDNYVLKIKQQLEDRGSCRAL